MTATGSNLVYQWKYNRTPIAGATGSSYTTPPSTRADNRTNLRVDVRNAAGSVTSKVAKWYVKAAASKPTPTPSATPTPTPTATQLVNVSTRVQVDKGDNVMIGGFIVNGDMPKAMVVRAIGPSLTDAGVKGALSDPILELYDSSGTLLTQNDDWTSLPAESVPSGFELSNPKESLISATLAPGLYTAVLRGKNGGTGVALCEFYDLDSANSTVSNISTRGLVGTGDNVLIGGFIIGGEASTKVIVRAIGPSLGKYGIKGALANPILELHTDDGSLIYANDNWRNDQEQQILDSNLQPSDDREAAIIATLPPGSYTAVIRGSAGGSGVALVEVYDLEKH